MFSTTSWWCWGSVPCYRSQAGSCSFSVRGHLCGWHTQHLCCQEAHTEDRIVGEQAIVFCQVRVPRICVNFSDCFPLVPHFLLLLPVALSSWSVSPPPHPPRQQTGEPSLPKLQAGLWWTPLQVLLIVKDQHTQPSAAEHVEGNTGHNQVSAQHRRHRKSQLWRRGLCHWCCRF